MDKLPRRTFLQSSLTAAGLLALGRQPISALSQNNSNPALSGGGFKLGMVTYNLAKDWDIPTIIKNCEQTGFEAVELRTTHKHGVEPTISKAQRQEVNRPQRTGEDAEGDGQDPGERRQLQRGEQALEQPVS